MRKGHRDWRAVGSYATVAGSELWFHLQEGPGGPAIVQLPGVGVFGMDLTVLASRLGIGPRLRRTTVLSEAGVSNSSSARSMSSWAIGRDR